MRELKEMGFISEKELLKFDKPVFSLGVKIPAEMTESSEIVAYLNLTCQRPNHRTKAI